MSRTRGGYMVAGLFLGVAALLAVLSYLSRRRAAPLAAVREQQQVARVMQAHDERDAAYAAEIMRRRAVRGSSGRE